MEKGSEKNRKGGRSVLKETGRFQYIQGRQEKKINNGTAPGI